MRGAYLIALLVSITGLLVLDRRYKIAFFRDKKRTWRVMLVAVTLFVVWDIAGIVLNIFFIGNTKLLTGVRVGEFPLEEIGFLFLLNYTSLMLYLGYKKVRVTQ